MAGHLARRLDHLADGVALTVAQVVGPAALIQGAQGQDVGLGQVGHVDIVAHAGAVAGGIVVAIDLDLFPLAQRHLEHQGDEMGFGMVVLASLGRGACRVESSAAPRSAAVNAIQPVQHPLQDELGLAVGAAGNDLLRLRRWGSRSGWSKRLAVEERMKRRTP